MTGIRTVVFVACCIAATTCKAEWEIVSVSTEPFSRDSYNGPPEVRMSLSLRNTSDRSILVWGQTHGPDNHFYLIESFIQNSDNAVWERQNVGICGSIGKTGWISVAPGETIAFIRVVFKRHVGRQMILTFRRAYSAGDAKGAEILLGPFTIPKPTKSEQSPGAYSSKASEGLTGNAQE